MKKRLFTITFCASISALMPLLSRANETGTETNGSCVEMPEMVLTATRLQQSTASLPYITETLSADDIQYRKLSRTTPDVFDEIPAVMVQKTGHGQGSPFIRGFTGYRDLFMINGIRLNNSVFRDGPNQYWNTVDPFTIGKLELVKGPSSVLYGSDAIGGTVNVLTPSPFDRTTEHPGGGRAYYRYSTAEDSHTVRGEGYGVDGDRLGLRAGVSYKDYGDLKAGDGKQPHTGYTEWDYDGEVAYIVTPNLELSLGHQTVIQDDAWRTHKTIYARGFHGTTVGNEKKRSLDQKRHLTYAILNSSEMPDFVNELNITLSHQEQVEDRDRIKKDDTCDKQGVAVHTLGASAEAVTYSRFGDWVYGVDYYRDYVDSYSKKYSAAGTLKSMGIQGPVADDSNYDLLGLYLQDSASLTERLDVILGGRYNYAKADAGAFEDPVTGKAASFSDDWDDWVGSLRAVLDVLGDDRANVYAGVSQGFRAPNLSDLTRLDTARSNEIETPFPGLDPEHYVAYEVGVKSDWDFLALECAYFYTDISDMIVRTPTGRMIDDNIEVTKKNAGDGYVQGIELSGSARLYESWSCWGNLTWMDGEVDTYPTSDPIEVHEPISRLMPLTVNAGIRFAPTPKYWFEAYMTAAAKQDDLSTRDRRDTQRIPPGGTPGYGVFSLRGGWQVTDALALSMALENIADKNYRIHGSGVNEPGRNLIIACDFAF